MGGRGQRAKRCLDQKEPMSTLGPELRKEVLGQGPPRETLGEGRKEWDQAALWPTGLREGKSLGFQGPNKPALRSSLRECNVEFHLAARRVSWPPTGRKGARGCNHLLLYLCLCLLEAIRPFWGPCPSTH